MKILLLLISILSFFPIKSFAAITAVPEFGFKKTAMGASIAKPDDLSAVYHNPAGIGLLKGNQFFFSFGAALPTTNINIRFWKNSERYIEEKPKDDGFFPEVSPNSSAAFFPMLGVSTSFLKDRLTTSLSLYIPNAVGAKFDENGLVRYHMVEGYFVAGSLTGTVAYKLNPKVIVGLGLSALYVKAYYRRKFYPIIKDKNLGEVRIDGLIGKNSEVILQGSDIFPSYNFTLHWKYIEKKI